MNNKTALYRYYNKREELIYVGVTRDPIARMAKHKFSSKWIYEAVLIGVEWFDTRAEAFIEEARTIKRESPVYNVMHNQDKDVEPEIKSFDTMVFRNIYGENIVLTKGKKPYTLSDNDLAILYGNANSVHVFKTKQDLSSHMITPQY